jgi:PEGA domain-containing protein
MLVARLASAQPAGPPIAPPAGPPIPPPIPPPIASSPAGPSPAEPPPASEPPVAAPAGDAAVHIQRGIAAYRARRFAQAADELLQANRLAPERPEPYRWLAWTEVEIDDCPSALLNVDAFLARAPQGDPAAPELLGVRDRCLHTGSVDVESSPAGAEVRIDGGPTLAMTPAHRLAMRIGTHAITLRKPGFATLHDRIEVRALGTNYASFALTPARDLALTRQWWFWVAVGAVAVTAIGVTYEATRTTEPHLAGITCTMSGCAP